MSESALFGMCLVVSYDGTAFSGFQRQPGQRTVQGELETAVQQMTGHEVTMRAASRTDSGVHALGQVVAFDSARAISARGFRRGLLASLPHDITIVSTHEVAAGYNPRFDSLGKIYRYVLELGEYRNPLWRNQVWNLGKFRKLSVENMRRAGRALEGTHDYRAFRSADDERENTVRTIGSIDVIENFMNQSTLVAIEVRGTAFMKNMVRVIAGTLVDVGRGRLSVDDMARLLGPKGERADAGQTAPAQGLVLVEVRLGRIEALARAAHAHVGNPPT